MKHLETFKVAFTGSVARKFNGDIYYQNSFEINGQICSAKSAIDYAGKCGIVQCLKAGELFNGNTIVADCFTIKSVTSAEIIRTAKQALQELMAA
jgi:hypothetical protein